VLFMFDWVMALICLGVFVTIVALTRYVSLGTISAAVLFLAMSFVPFFGHTFYFQVFACLMALIIILKHWQNIQRLLSGTENRLAF
jgi:glycerol-3-phosphate acyltransferase PlsY